METTPVNGVLDIIGVVESVGDYMDITLKNGSATHKRSVQLRDQSNASIEVRFQLMVLRMLLSLAGGKLGQSPCKIHTKVTYAVWREGVWQAAGSSRFLWTAM